MYIMNYPAFCHITLKLSYLDFSFINVFLFKNDCFKLVRIGFKTAGFKYTRCDCDISNKKQFTLYKQRDYIYTKLYVQPDNVLELTYLATGTI